MEVKETFLTKIKMSKTQFISQTALIAALYAAVTLVALVLLQGLAWGPIQFRVSEALCVLALFTPAAIPGLTLGCIIANLINIPLSGVGVLGLLDVAFGSLATFLGALACWNLRSKKILAINMFTITNALIVPAYLPILLQGLGFYTIPFTDIALDGFYLAMYFFGVISTGIGEAVVINVIGLPLAHMLKKSLKGTFSALLA